MIRPTFRNTLLARFKGECAKIEDETRHAVRVDDRSHYDDDGKMVDVVHIAIYPTLRRSGAPLHTGVVYNFGKIKYAA